MNEPTTAVAERSTLSPLWTLLGRDILGAMVDQLRAQPDHWHRMNEANQQKAIANLREKTKVIVQNAVRVLASGAEYKAVSVELDGLTFKDGIKGQFLLPKGADGRHELADAIGTRVLVVLANPDAYLERMEEVKAAADQMDLFGGEYDPSADAPRYRRDEKEDRLSPARTGLQSWAELMDKLKGGVITKEQAEAEYGGPLPAEQPSEESADPLAFLDAIVGPFTINEAHELGVQIGDGGYVLDLPLVLKEGETLRQRLAELFPGVALTPLPPLVFGTAAEKSIDERSRLHVLLERLFAVGMTISLGTLQTFSNEQIDLAEKWVEAYAADPENCAIQRPYFLPVPDSGYKPGADDQTTNEG